MRMASIQKAIESLVGGGSLCKRIFGKVIEKTVDEFGKNGYTELK